MAPILRYLTLVLLLSYDVTCIPSRSQQKKQLLYILIDGFRYDYVDRQDPQNLPGFTKFLGEGVRAKWMTAIFPSVSYPDWTTLVTGLYPETHGIVGNYIYDAEEQDYFALFDADKTGMAKWWMTAEPIWSTSTKGGLTTGVILWSRCDVPFNGVTPEYCEPFVKIMGHEIFRTNIDKAIEKLEENFDFVMVYNEHTDNVGHNSGPETEDINQAVRELDAIILHLQEQLEARGLADNVNIIIVSDHGMVSTAPGVAQRVELDDYLPLQYVEKIVDTGAFSNIKVAPGYLDQAYESLQEMPGVEVYRHDEIPDSFHFKNHRFIHDILIKANIDTWIMRSHSQDKMFPPREDDNVVNGNHGYDPNEEKMRAIFFAKGPDFKAGETIEPIRNVDVYPLLAHLLGVQPNPHNGTLSSIALALAEDPPTSSSHSLNLYIQTVVACLLTNSIFF